MKIDESTGSGFESQHELFFSHILYQRIYETTILLKHQNQLRLVSISSHTGGADLGHARLFKTNSGDNVMNLNQR